MMCGVCVYFFIYMVLPFVFVFRNVRNDRATPAEIASYYQHYVSQMSLEQNFACGTTVTSVTRQPGGPDGSPPCWRVTGLQRREGEMLGGTAD